MEEINFDKILEAEMYRITTDGIGILKKIMMNIEEFIRYVESHEKEIVDKLSSIKAVQIDGGAMVLDPTAKLFSIIRVEPLGDTFPKVYLIRMEPPVIPHFFLFLSYFHRVSGLYPSVLFRTEPVYSLVSLVVRGGLLVASAVQAYAGILALERYIMGEVVILPFDPKILELPVNSERLYLTSMGFSTSPLPWSGFNIEVDVSDIPGIDEDTFSKLNFVSLKDIVEDMSRVVVD